MLVRQNDNHEFDIRFMNGNFCIKGTNNSILLVPVIYDGIVYLPQSYYWTSEDGYVEHCISSLSSFTEYSIKQIEDPAESIEEDTEECTMLTKLFVLANKSAVVKTDISTYVKIYNWYWTAEEHDRKQLARANPVIFYAGGLTGIARSWYISYSLEDFYKNKYERIISIEYPNVNHQQLSENILSVL